MQFRRNRDVTDALLGSVVSHAVATSLLVGVAAVTPLLGSTGLIAGSTEYLLTTTAYPLFVTQAALHPLLTISRHKGLRSETAKIWQCWHGAQVEQQHGPSAGAIYTVTAGTAHKEHEKHFQMLRLMWA